MLPRRPSERPVALRRPTSRSRTVHRRRVASKPNLDVSVTEATSIVQYSPAVSSDSAARRLVLVVEDEPAIAEVIRLYLAKAGFGVHLEADGEAGLAACRSLRPAAPSGRIRMRHATPTTKVGPAPGPRRPSPMAASSRSVQQASSTASTRPPANASGPAPLRMTRSVPTTM